MIAFLRDAFVSARSCTSGQLVASKMQDDSPTVDDGRGKRPRVVETGSQNMETDQLPESELSLVLEVDDLNATVTEVMTDVEVLLEGSSVE